jgi:hypothetical protein
MNRKWLNHIPNREDKDKFKQRLIAERDIFQLLKSILEEQKWETSKSRRSLNSVLTQNYSEFQADRNATERTLQEIIDLLPLED